MQRLIVLQIFTIVALNFASGAGERYYSVTAPGVIKSNRNYTISLTLHGAGEPAVVRVSLVGEPIFYYNKTVELQPFESQLIYFVPPKLDSQYECRLLVEGLRGLEFRNTSHLLVDDMDHMNIYIQTDKGVYKPGDTVQFRAIILDEHLRPFEMVEPVRVEIRDGNRNRVKQFKDVPLNNGVFSSHFKLSEHPVLGKWLIVVTVSGKYDISNLKAFQVEQYVLPKFSVHIEGDGELILSNKSLSIQVYGKYTYGRYVEGTAKVQLIHPHYNKVLVSQEGTIQNHRANFLLDLQEIADLYNLPAVGITATIVEEQTGLEQTAQQNFDIHREKYKIIVPESEIEFHDSKPYKMSAYVEAWNGTRVINTKIPFYMKHGNRTYTAYQDPQGVATFTFDYELKANNIFTYDGSSTHVPNIFIGSNMKLMEILTQCTLKWKEGRLKFGTTIDLEVSSRHNIPYLVYTITSHASIVRLQSVVLPPNQRSYIIRVRPTVDMLPRSHIYVHYIEQGQFRYCEMKLTFPEEFENQVSIDAPSTAVPGQNVTLQLQAEPNSFVGLLAVDLSVHLLNSEYNLNKEEIFGNVIQDLTYATADIIYPGQQSGLLTLTNAHYTYITPRDTTVRTRSSSTVQPSDLQNSANVRSKFPETWIFMNLNVEEPFTQLELTVPDTITTWLITAFSINPITGFGMMTYPTNLTVFKPFFISTNLPYSIKRGEVVKISATVFNYHANDVDTVITMQNNYNDFEFTNEEKTPNLKRLNVPANTGRSEYFMIKAKKLGYIDIHLEASSHVYKDAIVQKLKVEPEGKIQQHTENAFVQLNPPGQAYETKFQISLPNNAVPGSEFTQLAMGGSGLASVLLNLDQLVQLPTGCGEQNMVNFAPNVLAVEYLRTLPKTVKNMELMDTALDFIQTGYQQELGYRHPSGGYSVFGPTSKTLESTWLTAYVLRFFLKAQRYASIESHILESGLEYLAEKQLPDGDFPLTGYLFYPAHQNRYGFTAFVLMTFLESSKFAKKYRTLITTSVNFLTTNLNDIEDTYALAIMATALQMAKSDYAPKVVGKLMQRAQESKGSKWWSSSDSSHTNDVEITAYVLMALLDLDIGDHVAPYKWLMEKRNVAGGFQSTHDTVVGVQTLIKYSLKYPSITETMLKADYLAKDANGAEVESGIFGIDPSNILVWQMQELPPTTRSLHVYLEGRGTTFLQLFYHYYVYPEINSNLATRNFTIATRGIFMAEEDTHNTAANAAQAYAELNSFYISPMAKISKQSILELEICFDFRPSNILKHLKSNMVIMEVHLPSGFVANSQALNESLDQDLIAKVQLKNEDSLILFYFEQLKANADDERCLSVKADKMHEVVSLKPAPIVMYDYYNLNYRDTVFYAINE